MTTIKEILDQFNSIYRYNPETIENINIGNYTFDEAYIDNTGYIMEFINTENPDTWLRINDDRIAILLIQKINEKEVQVTSWRMGQKHTKKFPYQQWKPYTGNQKKPLPTKQ